jgi:uncharacterized membrane protein
MLVGGASPPLSRYQLSAISCQFRKHASSLEKPRFPFLFFQIRNSQYQIRNYLPMLHAPRSMLYAHFNLQSKISILQSSLLARFLIVLLSKSGADGWNLFMEWPLLQMFISLYSRTI